MSGASGGKKRTSGLEFTCYDLQRIMCDPLFSIDTSYISSLIIVGYG